MEAARRWLLAQLAELYDDLAEAADDAVLLVSELVTNSVRAGPGQVVVGIDAHRGSLTLSVTDDAPGEPVRRTATPQDVTGRGLSIVDAVSTAWACAASGAARRSGRS